MKRNFTLVELLVVVAVIAALIGMLAPALRSAMDKAREIACRSNLKQCVMMTSQYVDDHDGYLFQRHVGVTAWPEFISRRGYATKDSNIMACPGGDPNSYDDAKAYYSYGVQAALFREEGASPTHRRLSELNEARVSDVPYIMDSSFLGNPGSSKYMRQSYYVHANGGADMRPFHMRHSRSGNIGFADGHADGVSSGDHRWGDASVYFNMAWFDPKTGNQHSN